MDSAGSVSTPSPRLERARVRRKALGDDAHDLGVEPEQVAHGDDAADPRTEPDRHVHDVERAGGEQLARVRRDAGDEIAVIRRHEMRVRVGRDERRGVRFRFVEITAVHDELRAERAHRGVLLRRVAFGHDDRRAQSGPRRGERDALPVVPARRADEPRHVRRALAQRRDVRQPAAHLERAERRMVLVLEPQLDAEPLAQQRPAKRGRDGHDVAHERRRAVDVGERQLQGHGPRRHHGLVRESRAEYCFDRRRGRVRDGGRNRRGDLLARARRRRRVRAPARRPKNAGRSRHPIARRVAALRAAAARHRRRRRARYRDEPRRSGDGAIRRAGSGRAAFVRRRLRRHAPVELRRDRDGDRRRQRASTPRQPGVGALRGPPRTGAARREPHARHARRRRRAAAISRVVGADRRHARPAHGLGARDRGRFGRRGDARRATRTTGACTTSSFRFARK